MTDHQILFDKLIYIDRLKRAGIDENLARAHAEGLEEALRDAVATKADIAELNLRLAQLETKLSIRVGSMIAVAVAILIGVKFLA